MFALQVYDLRAAPHMTGSVAFPAGPSLLRFHPKFSTTLLIASSSGTFTLADSSGTTFARYERVRSLRPCCCPLDHQKTLIAVTSSVAVRINRYPFCI